MLITTSKTLKEVVNAIQNGEKFYLHGSQTVLSTISIKLDENGEFVNSENLTSLSVDWLEKELNAGNVKEIAMLEDKFNYDMDDLHVCNGEYCEDQGCPNHYTGKTDIPEGKYQIKWPEKLPDISVGKAGFNEQYLCQPRQFGKTFMQQQLGRMKRQSSDFNKLATMIHADMVEVGWWDNPDQCLLEKLQMVSTEIAEATEGERKDLMDDKLPHRKMGEVELADTLIRVLDLGGKLGLEYSDDIKKNMSYKNLIIEMNKTTSIAGKHFLINLRLMVFGSSLILNVGITPLSVYYSVLIESIMEVGKFCGYDIISALHEKCAYNRERADHKRENRAKSDGKKF